MNVSELIEDYTLFEQSIQNCNLTAFIVAIDNIRAINSTVCKYAREKPNL